VWSAWGDPGKDRRVLLPVADDCRPGAPRRVLEQVADPCLVTVRCDGPRQIHPTEVVVAPELLGSVWSDVRRIHRPQKPTGADVARLRPEGGDGRRPALLCLRVGAQRPEPDPSVRKLQTEILRGRFSADNALKPSAGAEDRTHPPRSVRRGDGDALAEGPGTGDADPPAGLRPCKRRIAERPGNGLVPVQRHRGGHPAPPTGTGDRLRSGHRWPSCCVVKHPRRCCHDALRIVVNIAGTSPRANAADSSG